MFLPFTCVASGVSFVMEGTRTLVLYRNFHMVCSASFYVKNRYSCTPDKDIRVFHLCLQIVSHPCYLTQGRIKITCIYSIGCIGSHVSTSSSDVGFYSRYVKNDVTLCKLNVNVKNRTAAAGSVDVFKLK